MKIDLHNNEEPLAVADTARELAEMCGVQLSSIYESVSRAKREGYRCRYIKVEDNDEER